MDATQMQAGRELDARVAVALGWKRGRHRLTGSAVGWLNPEGRPDNLPFFSTKAAADYTVLEHVRREWNPAQKLAFAHQVERVWRDRRRERARADDSISTESEALQYEPGDYSRAALLALDTPEP